MRLVDHVRPYFILANTFIRSISGIFTRPIYKESNKTVVPGFMEHDPKESAIKHFR